MNLEEFIDMGGYAFYVWTSYGLTLVVLLANILSPFMQRRRLLTDLARRAQREERMKQ